MKIFLLYWGEGYGEHARTARVITEVELITEESAFGEDLVVWAINAQPGDETNKFSGPCDYFYIRCMED